MEFFGFFCIKEKSGIFDLPVVQLYITLHQLSLASHFLLCRCQLDSSLASLAFDLVAFEAPEIPQNEV